jgi:hypothetical protein
MKRKSLEKVLTEELGRLVLRAYDIGKIKGEFEEHYLGPRKENDPRTEIPKEIAITPALCKEWHAQVTKLARERRLAPEEVSEDLDTLFHNFFNATLPEGRHVTLEMCNAWRDKHMGFLIEIWLRRKKSAQKCKGSSRKGDNG